MSTFVHLYPRIHWLFLAKNPLWVLGLNSIPLLILLSLLANFNTVSIPLILVGALYWTLLEYIIHRWIYHIPVKNRHLRLFIDSFHRYHHTNPGDPNVLNAGPFLVFPLVVFYLSPFYFLSGFNLSFAATIGLGAVSAYTFYEFIHFLIHYKLHRSGYLKVIQSYHFYHHTTNASSNFGNTSSLWDHVFGTYDPGYKKFRFSDSERRTLIRSDL